MKLPGSTKNKIAKYENREKATNLEITEKLLVHCSMLTTIINNMQQSCIRLFQINHLVNYQMFHLKNLYF